MPAVFFLTKLREGADREKYEKWVTEYDYPTCKKHFRSVLKYTTFRVNEESRSVSPYDYIEHIDLTSVEEYKRELETPEFQELLRQWSEFVDADSALVVYSDPVE